MAHVVSAKTQTKSGTERQGIRLGTSRLRNTGGRTYLTAVVFSLRERPDICDKNKLSHVQWPTVEMVVCSIRSYFHI